MFWNPFNAMSAYLRRAQASKATTCGTDTQRGSSHIESETGRHHHDQLSCKAGVWGRSEYDRGGGVGATMVDTGSDSVTTPRPIFGAMEVANFRQCRAG